MMLLPADNWKLCAAGRNDGCNNQPPLGPDEDDPQCKPDLPWACCTTGGTIPTDGNSQCSLKECISGTTGPDNNYCQNTGCLTYQLNTTETSFTFYVSDGRFVSDITWPDPPNRPCGGDGSSSLCPQQSSVSSYADNVAAA
jgi:hypothetical protein